jgi:hypothetical protein
MALPAMSISYVLVILDPSIVNFALLTDCSTGAMPFFFGQPL